MPASGPAAVLGTDATAALATAMDAVAVGTGVGVGVGVGMVVEGGETPFER